MPQRVCASCGKSKDVSGAKICENDHFICKDCYYSTQGFMRDPSKYCPVCKKPLR